MSVAREVKVNYDLEVLAQAARDCGYRVENNATGRSWYGNLGNNTKYDMVIKGKTMCHSHYFDMGFKQTADGVQMEADFHGEQVNKDMAQEILPRYVELMAERSGRWEVDRRVNEKGKTQMFLRSRY